jgi:hypothetical protein
MIEKWDRLPACQNERGNQRLDPDATNARHRQDAYATYVLNFGEKRIPFRIEYRKRKKLAIKGVPPGF